MKPECKQYVLRQKEHHLIFLSLKHHVAIATLCLLYDFHIYNFKNFANFTGKHLCWSLFLIKLQDFRAETLLKRDSNTGVFLWNLRNF